MFSRFFKLAIAVLLAGQVSALAQTRDTKSLPPFGQQKSALATPVPSQVRAVARGSLSSALGKVSRFANAKYSDPSLKTRGAKEAALYKRVSPSVVLIVTKDGDDTGIGSGSLLDTSGNIITNWHVVKGFTEVAVIFKPLVEGQEPTEKDIVRGRVERIDEIADLALIKVGAVPAGHAPVKLGAESDIGVGLDVFAIGHPRGDQWTYTKGIISQFRKGYEWTYQDKSEHKADLIQTQTPINPGNSGGPLLSEAGALIGVNSFKSDGEGLNFAVSIGDVNAFLARKADRIAERKPSDQMAAKDCQPKVLDKGRLKDNSGEFVAVDMSCAGRTNAFFVSPDDTSKPLELMLDRNGDAKTDGWILDANRDKKWDISFWNSKFDDTTDLVGLHPDGEIEPTSFMSYASWKIKYGK